MHKIAADVSIGSFWYTQHLSIRSGGYQNWELILQELVRSGINPSHKVRIIINYFIEFRFYKLKLLSLNVVNFTMESTFIYCYFIYLFNCYISFLL